MTELALIEAAWNQAATGDAMFNIITDPAKANGGWTSEEFFAHGQDEIDRAMERLADLVDIRLGRALDFGCGLGRLTQALTDWFGKVEGVDVSEEMVIRAREHNEHDVVTFHHNARADLGMFKDRTFDLVYSMIVLQHMPQDMQHGYVGEFFRVLKPGGVAMFHTPEGPDSGHPGWALSMFGVHRATVEEWIAGCGGTLIDVEDLGVDSGWRNLRYTATA
jgi:2-polyprenyl-3-methyl-5-hydroxy-6-metoxy-1,4-benzoquinol methylase